MFASSCFLSCSVRPSDETPRTHTLSRKRTDREKNNQPKGSGERLLALRQQESFAQSFPERETHLFCGHTWHLLLPAASGRNFAPLCDSFSLIFTTFSITGSHQKTANVAPFALLSARSSNTTTTTRTATANDDDERDLFIFWRLQTNTSNGGTVAATHTPTVRYVSVHAASVGCVRERGGIFEIEVAFSNTQNRRLSISRWLRSAKFAPAPTRAKNMMGVL